MRWQHQARLSGVAVDCIGLIGVVALALRLEGAQAWADDDELKRYGCPPMPRVLLAGVRKYMSEIQLAAVRAGDVLVLAVAKHPTIATHFAIVTRTAPLYIIHAETMAQRVVESRCERMYAPLHAFRFRGLAI